MDGIRRKLEGIINSAWSSAADIGAWLFFDEQMFKDTSVAGGSLQRYNPSKPIKRGKCRPEVEHDRSSISFIKGLTIYTTVLTVNNYGCPTSSLLPPPEHAQAFGISPFSAPITHGPSGHRSALTVSVVIKFYRCPCV